MSKIFNSKPLEPSWSTSKPGSRFSPYQSATLRCVSQFVSSHTASTIQNKLKNPKLYRLELCTADKARMMRSISLDSNSSSPCPSSASASEEEMSSCDEGDFSDLFPSSEQLFTAVCTKTPATSAALFHDPSSPISDRSSPEPATPSISGQVNYQCSRCFIVHPTLESIEVHIGQFHMRMGFQLDEDNFRTLVKPIWDANLNLSILSSYVRESPEPIGFRISDKEERHQQISLKQQQQILRDLAPTPPSSVCSLSRSSTPEIGESGLDSELEEMAVIPEMPKPLPVYNKHKFDLGRSLPSAELEMPPALPNPKLMLHYPRKFKSIEKQQKRRREISRGMKRVSKLIAKLTDNKIFRDKRPSKIKRLNKMLREERKRDCDSGSEGKGKKGERKCRSVYGIHNQEQWCNMCKWKKRCARFGGQDGSDV